MIENNGYQDALLEWIDEKAGSKRLALPLRPYTTGTKKMDEGVGLPSLAAEIDNGKWEILLGDREHEEDCPCNFCTWINEMMGYPIETYSDTVMACFFAREASKFGSHKIEVTTSTVKRVSQDDFRRF